VKSQAEEGRFRPAADGGLASDQTRGDALQDADRSDAAKCPEECREVMSSEPTRSMPPTRAAKVIRRFVAMASAYRGTRRLPDSGR
jgi:hypothetical protein